MTAIEADGGSWRPASISEVLAFEDNWCAHCMNHSEENEYSENGCGILDGVYAHRQPPEVTVRCGQPWCTAYEENQSNPARCLFTKEMDL